MPGSKKTCTDASEESARCAKKVKGVRCGHAREVSSPYCPCHDPQELDPQLARSWIYNHKGGSAFGGGNLV
jgi:hypothetical protein